MNSSDKSIADATGKMKQWIVQAYNDVKQEVQQTNSFYSSSLMIQLFLRRVVEINFIEGCYDKVRRVWMIDLIWFDLMLLKNEDGVWLVDLWEFNRKLFAWRDWSSM